MPKLGTWRENAMEVLEEYNNWTGALELAIDQEANRPSWMYAFQTRDENRAALDHGERDFTGMVRYARYFGAALAQRPDLASEANPLFHGERGLYWDGSVGQRTADAVQAVCDREGVPLDKWAELTLGGLFKRAVEEAEADAHDFWRDNPEAAPEWWLDETWPEKAACQFPVDVSGTECGRKFRVGMEGDAGGDVDLCPEHAGERERCRYCGGELPAHRARGCAGWEDYR
jgi:hypothetical protein